MPLRQLKRNDVSKSHSELKATRLTYEDAMYSHDVAECVAEGPPLFVVGKVGLARDPAQVELGNVDMRLSVLDEASYAILLTDRMIDDCDPVAQAAAHASLSRRECKVTRLVFYALSRPTVTKYAYVSQHS